MELENLIAECTAYDFKLMLEEKKPKSWLKSVSAFANGFGGSLFFGIDNDGILKGLDNLQYVCETISSKIRDYMEKRGSGLTRICNETKALDGYKDELKPVFKSTPTQFQTIIFASGEKQNVGDFVGDMSEMKLTERQQKILNLIKESPTISAKQMSETLSVTTRTIERDLSLMKKAGVLKREGKDNNGKWIVIESLLR
jgi:predicted HTH transcriptional regulator